MSATLRKAPVLNVRFSDPEFREDGWAAYERIRAAGPVVYSPGPLDAGDLAPNDGYLLTGYRTCARVLGNVRKFQQPPEFYTNKFGDLVFEGIDGQRHDDIRGVWAHEFQRERLKEARLDIVEEVVAEHLDPFLDRVLAGETLDAVSELHRRIPLSVMLYMLDLPRSDHDMLLAWTDMMSGIALVDGTAQINAYLAVVAEERAKNPGPDLISMMLTSDLAKTMTRGEIVANSGQLVFAGGGTTTSLMSSCLILLAKHPDQRRAAQADRTLMPQAIEEAMRFKGVTQVTAPRIVTDGDAEIDGVRVPEGAQAVPIVGAANRDPSRWDRPGEFDIVREHKGHLGFGFGMHNCLGLNLARLEVDIYLNRLLDRLPEWQIPAEIKIPGPFDESQAIPISAA